MNLTEQDKADLFAAFVTLRNIISRIDPAMLKIYEHNPEQPPQPNPIQPPAPDPIEEKAKLRQIKANARKIKAALKKVAKINPKIKELLP